MYPSVTSFAKIILIGKTLYTISGTNVLSASTFLSKLKIPLSQVLSWPIQICMCHYFPVPCHLTWQAHGHSRLTPLTISLDYCLTILHDAEISLCSACNKKLWLRRRNYDYFIFIAPRYSIHQGLKTKVKINGQWLRVRYCRRLKRQRKGYGILPLDTDSQSLKKKRYFACFARNRRNPLAKLCEELKTSSRIHVSSLSSLVRRNPTSD